jgi:2,3-bisphosphoglycerate-independent phosphoglycerate mutase
MAQQIKPLVLVILDGWGYREEADYNAIAQANIPTWNKLWSSCPHGLIQGSGHCVGLPMDKWETLKLDT